MTLGVCESIDTFINMIMVGFLYGIAYGTHKLIKKYRKSGEKRLKNENH